MISINGRFYVMIDEKYFIDDRVIIPDDIKNMSQEEPEEEIRKFEEEIRTVNEHKALCTNITPPPHCVRHLPFQGRHKNSVT